MIHFVVARGLPLVWIGVTLVALYLTWRSLRVMQRILRMALTLPENERRRALRIRLAQTPVENIVGRAIILLSFLLIGVIAILMLPMLWARLGVTVALFVAVSVLGEKSRREIRAHQEEIRLLEEDERIT